MRRSGRTRCAALVALAALSGGSLVASAMQAAGAASDETRDSIAGPLRIVDNRGPLRAVDLSPYQGDRSNQILAGPTSGLDSAYIIHARTRAGARPKGLYTLPADHTYMVMSGRLNVQLGTEKFVAGPDTLVFVPAGVPHQAWNEGSEQAVDLQVVAPAPSRDLAGMMTPAVARKIDNAAQYVRVAPPLGELAGGTGHASLNERILANRANGSEHVLERLNDMLPGGGRTETHMHPFDQAYFIKQGTMAVEYGLSKFEAPANSLVVLPTGVAHNNLNTGTSVQSVVTLLLPEPLKGNPMGAGVEINRRGGRE